MSNSKMVDYFRQSPNYYKGRPGGIERITPHCVVGQCSVETLGAIFSRPEKDASCNYGIGYDGKIGCYVNECDTSWCSSSYENDSKAVTIEIASDVNSPWAVRDAAWASAIDLMEDICRRNGKNRVIWFNNKVQTVEYEPKPNEVLLSVHRWWANKACPGTWIMSRMDALKDELNRRLASNPNPAPAPHPDESEVCEVTLPILRLNNESGYVRTLQILLNKYNGARLAEDGAFGPATLAAVKAYQKSRGLEVDGIVGAKTWAQLLK